MFKNKIKNIKTQNIYFSVSEYLRVLFSFWGWNKQGFLLEIFKSFKLNQPYIFCVAG